METETHQGEMASFASLDMDGDIDQVVVAPPISKYETIYVTSHKAPCRAGAFSPDSRLIATGSADASIKILDVERMISKSTVHAANQQQGDNNPNLDPDHHDNQDSNSGHDGPNGPMLNQQHNQQQHHSAHPVIRTLYDHAEEVTYLKFHPTAPVLASGSTDMTIKFYDYARASAKRANKTIQEASPIRCFAFHPNGHFMLVGCQQPTLRLYDINTVQSYVSSNPLDQHSAPITMIDYNRTASFYVTGSKDGDIKIWDGVSNRCVNTFKRAHEGSVSSVTVSRNGKYILSAGKDSLVKLWEMSMCGCLMVYEGASNAPAKNYRAQAIFNHTEDYILYPDCRNTILHSWSARTGKLMSSTPLCHNNSVRFMAHSPGGSSFVTCSEDYRARFWSVIEKETIAAVAAQVAAGGSGASAMSVVNKVE